MSTANAGDLVFAGASQGSAAVTWSPGTGFIVRASQGAPGTMAAAVEEQLVTATGTYDAAFTMSAAAPWTSIGVALKSTAPSASNNMAMVSSNVFDGGSAGGDGNLTQQTLYTSSSATRVTNWGFDFRDRKVNMTDAISRYAVWTVDNLDRQTLTQLYATSSGYLAAQSGVNFDARGRVYQQLTYAVDPDTGDVGNVLTGNSWYDPSGNLVQQIAPGAGQVFTKSAYNGVNWTTASYTGYNTSGVSYDQAQIVTGDIIIEQAQNTFDEVGTAVSVASFMRLNDASTSTTGALTSSIARIMYTAAWSDGIDRQIAFANYGAASSFTRPSTPPSTSSTVLVNSTSYDEASRVYQTTDPKSIVNQRTYDNASRTTQTVEDVAGLARTTNYTYTLDNLIATMTAVNSTTGNQTTAWTHGTALSASGVARADLLLHVDYPDSVSGSDRVAYNYNYQSEVSVIFDQRGNHRAIDYDELGRKTAERITTLGAGTDGSVRNITWAYEVRGMVSTVTSYSDSIATTIVNQVQLNYNTFGQLSQEYQEHSGAVNTSTSVSVQYAYDSGGSGSNEIRLNTLIYPNGRNITYSFGTSSGMNDRLNRVDTIQDTTSGTTNLASYTYLGLGTVVRIAYPQPSVWLDLWGGTSGVFAGLDLFNRVIDQRWQNNTGGTPVDIDRYKYGYDFNSNRQYKANVVGTANVAAGLDEYYTYDDINRLTDMQRGVLNGTNTGITGTPAREMNYTLDPTGNWPAYLTKTAGTTDLNQGRASNTVNEITSITESGGTPLWVTPVYDAAGNMTTMPQPGTPTSSFTATYDAWNRMTGVDSGGSPVGQYTYDGRNRRIISVMTQTRHFYFTDSWQDIEQRVGTASTMDQQHVWGIRYIDELVCRDDATPERLYATQDTIFSVTGLLSESGAPQQYFVYDPYGIAAVFSGAWAASSDAFTWGPRFTGQQFDAETQAYLYRSRFYQPVVAVFTSRDQVGYADSAHLYQYARSNPASYMDPLGLGIFSTTTRDCIYTGEGDAVETATTSPPSYGKGPQEHTVSWACKCHVNCTEIWSCSRSLISQLIYGDSVRSTLKTWDEWPTVDESPPYPSDLSTQLVRGAGTKTGPGTASGGAVQAVKNSVMPTLLSPTSEEQVRVLLAQKKKEFVEGCVSQCASLKGQNRQSE